MKKILFWSVVILFPAMKLSLGMPAVYPAVNLIPFPAMNHIMMAYYAKNFAVLWGLGALAGWVYGTRTLNRKNVVLLMVYCTFVEVLQVVVKRGFFDITTVIMCVLGWIVGQILFTWFMKTGQKLIGAGADACRR